MRSQPLLLTLRQRDRQLARIFCTACWRGRDRTAWSGLCRPGHGAELLHEGEEVCHTRMLGDLSVVHAHGVHGFEVDLPAGRRHAQERSLRDIWSGMQADKQLMAVELAESRANGALLAAAMTRVHPSAAPQRIAASAFLIWQLGEATMRWRSRWTAVNAARWWMRSSAWRAGAFAALCRQRRGRGLPNRFRETGCPAISDELGNWTNGRRPVNVEEHRRR
jgi:hypothetical protein